MIPGAGYMLCKAVLGRMLLKPAIVSQVKHGKCVAKLPWRTTRAEAQADLDAYARKGGRLYEIYERYVTCRMPAGIDAAASG